MPRSMPTIILNAAQVWKKRILRGEESLLGGAPCWNVSTIRDLRVRFEDNPIEGGDESFFDKLKIQLTGAPEETAFLASEILWLLYLFPSNIGAIKKRQNIANVWNWTGKPLVIKQDLLTDEVLAGVGSGGPGFNNHIWREFLFAIILCDELVSLTEEKRRTMLEAADPFASWLDAITLSKNRQFRHMILFLLFPTEFERVSSKREKRAILKGFNETVAADVSDERLSVDIALRKLRARLSIDKGSGDFDFYDADLKMIWKPSEPGEDPPGPDKHESETSAEMTSDIAAGVRYWLVGANWDGKDKTPEFVDSGAWLNGYEDKYLDRVRSARPGDKIAIKAAFRQKNGLPFDNKGHDVGIMRIKARGTVTVNPGDGRRLVVEWEEDFESFDIYGYAWQPTISELSSKKWPEAVAWIFYSVKQPIRELAASWWHSPPTDHSETPHDDISYNHVPINRIFYGPPGTGKTFMLEAQGAEGIERMTDYLSKDRVDGKVGLEVVTFHQSFSYEDFIEGLRPIARNGGVAYEVRDGLFKKLCVRALDNPDKKFALFIDEINRGNVSSIFGELITLIEPGKRLRFSENGEPGYSAPGTTVRLPVSDDLFGIPCNVDIYATMNTADRSLVRMDTALRRRFEFVECLPHPEILAGRIIEGVDLEKLLAAMNERIEVLLDRDHTIGHAYFMAIDAAKGIEALALLFERKIIPLLEEYFFEDWGRIAKVLGDSKKADASKRFIIPISTETGAYEDDSALSGKRYRKRAEALRNPAAYIGVYE
jgi:5-methylcytosine-specific restriction protein B